MRTIQTLRRASWIGLIALAIGGCSYPRLYENGKIDEEYFDRVAQRTSDARGLPFTKPVPHEVISIERARELIEADAKRDADAADDKALTIAWQALGFTKPSESHDLEQEEVDLTAEQAAAFYDPHEKKFFISGVTDKARGISTCLASWALDRDLVSEMVVSHELVHALQDQRYDLEKFEKIDKNDDAALARRAVIEGDATYYGIESLAPGKGTTSKIELTRESLAGEASGEAFERVPKILREELFFSYWAGFTFVKQTHNAPPPERPWTDPPTSTSEILHPERYLAPGRKKPAPPTLGSDVPPGFALVRENTVGEFGIRVLLEGAEASAPEAEAASRGWAGDRYRVFEKSETKALALAWALTFETPDDARAFVHAYRLFQATKPGAGEASIAMLSGEKDAIVVEAPDGATAQKLLAVVSPLPTSPRSG
jgi:hypothetical protein